jgi:hypothetical protein
LLSIAFISQELFNNDCAWLVFPPGEAVMSSILSPNSKSKKSTGI